MGWRRLAQRHLQVVGGMIFAATILYLVGLKPFLPLVLVVASMLYLPVPRALQSGLGRLFASLLVNLALLQIAGIVQFAALPQSNFSVLAIIYAIFGFLLLVWLGKERQALRPVVSRADVAALAVAVVFLLPFAGILVGQDSVPRIVQLGGLQSPDASHHFEFINSMMANQHLDTSGYPKAFHLSVGFVQEAFVGSQAALSWQANVVVFFAQYMVFGAALAYALTQLCLRWARWFAWGELTRTQLALASLALAMPLALVILWPFVVHGFLNYFYTIVALVVGALYIGDFERASKKLPSTILLLGLLILFSATQSWPLIAPAVLLYIAFVLWPSKGLHLRDFKKLMSLPYVPVVLAIALQFVPVILQLAVPGRTSVNDQGDLRVLPIFMLLAGVGLLVVVAFGKKATEHRQRLFNLFLPFVLCCVALILMQFLLLGEARYFSIKASLLLLALFMVLGVAVVAGLAFRVRWPVRYLLVLPVLPLAMVILLVGASPEPFKDVRNLFRDQLGQPKPAFYDHDAYLYAKLGKAGEIDDFNSTILHYDTGPKKLVAHTFLAQWAQFIKYPRDELGQQAWACHRLIFHNVVYGNFTDAEQKALVVKVRECAQLAQQAGKPYYIITDERSLPMVKALIGERAGIVYVSS